MFQPIGIATECIRYTSGTRAKISDKQKDRFQKKFSETCIRPRVRHSAGVKMTVSH